MPRQSRVMIAITLVLITVATFFPVANLGFILYDDPAYITENRIVQHGLTQEGLKWAFTQLHAEHTYYHPVTWITHMLDCQFFGLNPRGHHLVSLGFHVANVLLLFWLFSQCASAALETASPNRPSHSPSPQPLPLAREGRGSSPLPGAVWPSALVAMLFAVHPLQVESVAWIAERKNLVSTFFALLTLLAYLRYTRRGSWRWYATAIAFFIMALLSKPAVVTLPFLMLLLDYWPFGRIRLFDGSDGPGAQFRKSRNLFFEKAPFFALSIASSIATIQAHRALGMFAPAAAPATGLKYGNLLLSYFDYVRTFICPIPLAIVYPFPNSISSGAVLTVLLVLGGVTAAVILSAKRRPFLLVGWLWFVGAMVPMSGIVSVGVQARADRFMYVPIIGLAIMMAFGVAQLFRDRPKVFPVAAALAGLACVAVSAPQLKYWKNDFTLFDHARRVTKDNFMAYFVIGNAYGKRGAYAEALTNFQAAVEMKRSFAEGYAGLGHAKLALGHPEEAVTAFNESLRRGNRPNPEAQFGLARAYQSVGNREAAITNFEGALRLMPDVAEGHRALGDLLFAKGQYRAAIVHFREALALEPNSHHALAGLAFVLATHEDPKVRNASQALEYSEKACRLTGFAEPGSLNTLAAAYAELGDFQRATNTAQKALDLARAQNQSNIIPTIEALLKTYRTGRPYRIGND